MSDRFLNDLEVPVLSSAPDSPASGYVSFYAKLAGLFFKTSAGSEVQLATSAASPSIGDFKISAQSTDHNGWLLCSLGRTVSRTTYSGIFSLVGTSFGAGDGSTTFGLPSPQGRVLGVIGSGTGLTTRAMGASVGAETHALTSAENGPHTHTYTARASSLNNVPQTGFNDGVWINTASGNTGSSGSGAPHNNMQPTLFIGNLFIYAGA